MGVKYRRKGFSRKALRAYLKGAPQKKHRCGDSTNCVVANFIADSLPFPGGTDYVQVFGNTIRFGTKGAGHKSTDREYDAPKWVRKVVDRFDRIKGTRNGLVTGQRAASELSELLG